MDGPRKQRIGATAGNGAADAGGFHDAAEHRQYAIWHDMPSGSRGAGWHVPEETARDNAYSLLHPARSAYWVLTAGQLAAILLLLAGCVVAYYQVPHATAVALSLAVSFFYLAISLFRVWLLAAIDRLPAGNWHTHWPVSEDRGPGGRYVVLAALYREERMVAALIENLAALHWEGEKTIVLICEEEDAATIAAIRRAEPGPDFRLLVVPHGEPRTKPRALNYALQQVDGDYLVIYDAEDRPHPGQLVEAARRFAASPPELACLQAPLVIDNPRASWFSTLFAIEYDTLFKGVLPTLCHIGAPIPLGGSSNHFRIGALRAAGAWDSYNVTEDADLGMRLARARYQCGTLNLPTFEEAPDRLRPWLTQRTRWLKGWMQTLLVHLRAPLRTARQMGWRGFAFFNIMLTSVVISALVHPLFLAAYCWMMALFLRAEPAGGIHMAIIGIANFNLVIGYLSYGFLAQAVERRLSQDDGRRGRSTVWLLTLPVYWLLISIAGWRAVLQLFWRPHRWEKTPHGVSRRYRPYWRQQAGAQDAKRPAP